MRVLLITYHFPPDAAIGAVRPYQMARLLPEYGIEPWILTVRPEFAEARDDALQIEGIPPQRILRTRVEQTARRRLLKSVSSLKTALHHATSNAPQSASSNAARSANGAPIAGAPMAGKRRNDDGWLDATPRRRWLLEWLDFPDRLAGWYRPAVAAGEAAIRRIGFDAILSSSPPRTVHFIARELATRHNLPWVMDLRDPWYRHSNALPSRTMQFLQQRLFTECAKHAEVIVLNTEHLRRHVGDATPRLVTKITAIPNGCIPAKSSEEDNSLAEAQSKEAAHDSSDGAKKSDSRVEASHFSIGHYGNVYSTRSAEPFLRGLRAWLDRDGLSENEVAVRFLGHEFGDAPRHIERLKLGSVVKLCPPVSRDRLPLLMRRDYVLLLMANDMPLQVPGKLFEYLAAGRRILATTEMDSPTADLLRHARDCAIAPDAQAVTTALQEFWRCYREGAPGAVSHGALLDECSYTHRTEQMAQVLKSVRPAAVGAPAVTSATIASAPVTSAPVTSAAGTRAAITPPAL